MKISKDEEIYLENLALKIQMSSESDLINYSLQFAYELVDCVLIALGIDLVLEVKYLVEEDFLDELEEEKFYNEFKKLIETKDKTVTIEFENEVGYKNFFLLMCRLCYFNLQHLKDRKTELEFLDVLYEKLN